MLKKYLLLLLFMPVVSFPMKRTRDAEPTQKEPVGGAMSANTGNIPSCQLLTTPGIIQRIVSDIDAVNNTGYIGIETPSLTNQEIINALKRAQKKGARVKIFVNDPQQENNSTALINRYKELESSQLSITQIPQLHAKRIVLAETIPATPTSKVTVYLGSLNLTEGSPLNYEIMMRCNDKAFFIENYQNQQRLGKHAQRAVQPIDFNIKNRRIIQSNSQEARTAINNFVQSFNHSCSHPHDHLYLSSFTLSDNAIIQSLIQAKKGTDYPISVIVDGHIFYKNDRTLVENRQYLKELMKNGINVYVFNINGTKMVGAYPKLFHIKALLRICDQECFSLISTANFTTEAQSQINYDLWQPCSLQFSMQLRRLFEQIIQESTQLTPDTFPRLLGNRLQNGKQLLELMKYPTVTNQNETQILQLIEHADLTVTDDESGHTALIKAINSANIPIVRALIQAGADVNIISTDPHSGEKTTPLLNASSMPILQLLLDADITDTINYSDRYGNTPLFKAVGAKNIEMVRALLAAGADPNIGGDFRSGERGYGPRGTTPPLIKAIGTGNLQIVNELLKYGADINATDQYGKTAFDRAKDMPHILELLEVIKLARENQL